jgi:hypothetical protein
VSKAVTKGAVKGLSLKLLLPNAAQLEHAAFYSLILKNIRLVAAIMQLRVRKLAPALDFSKNNRLPTFYKFLLALYATAFTLVKKARCLRNSIALEHAAYFLYL